MFICFIFAARLCYDINVGFVVFSNPTLKQEVEIPEISDAVAKQILVKCVAVLFAQISFESNLNCLILEFW